MFHILLSKLANDIVDFLTSTRMDVAILDSQSWKCEAVEAKGFSSELRSTSTVTHRYKVSGGRARKLWQEYELTDNCKYRNLSMSYMSYTSDVQNPSMSYISYIFNLRN